MTKGSARNKTLQGLTLNVGYHTIEKQFRNALLDGRNL